MPNILKNFFKSDAYVFPDAMELSVGEPPPRKKEEAESSPPGAEPEGTETGEKAEQPKENPVDYAQIQARALLEDARREVEIYKQETLRAFEEELEALRAQAREDGYREGFAQGMAEGNRAAAVQQQKAAEEQAAAVTEFLRQATKMRDRLLDESREELKDLAMAIAEKVIRLSLKGSSDILVRMVEYATDKHKRCEWVHVYIADCDVHGQETEIFADLAGALRQLSNRVRIIPMADDESGTCIIEMPDEILDASVSTQLGNIREVLSNTALDKEE